MIEYTIPYLDYTIDIVSVGIGFIIGFVFTAIGFASGRKKKNENEEQKNTELIVKAIEEDIPEVELRRGCN